MTLRILRTTATLCVTAVLTLSFMGVVGIAHAEEGEHSTTSTPPASSVQSSASVEKSQLEKRQEVSQKLAEAKKKVCEQRGQIIAGVMSRMGERTQKQIEKMDAISKRVQEFYAKKGKTVANYDTLVAEVNAKQAAAKAAAEHVGQERRLFSCGGDNPQGVVQEFRTAHHALIEAMKAYKTAVKNLIVAIKTAQGGTQ